MTAEIIVSLCIVVVCISPLIILGIVQYNSKSPVGFWAGQDPHKAAEISDIRAYNHKHGIMWITYGIGFIGCFATGYFFGEDWGLIAAVLSGIEVFGGLVGMVAYHNALEKRYWLENGQK